MKYILIILMLAATGCSKEDSEMRLSSLDTPVITGYEMRDMFGNVIRTIGEPNIKLGDKSNDFNTSDYFFACYPNPTSGYFAIWFKMPSDSVLKKVWITPAIDITETNSDAELNPYFVQIGGASIIDLETYAHNVSIRMAKCDENDPWGINCIPYPDGPYRVYVQIDNILLWDNIYLINN